MMLKYLNLLFYKLYSNYATNGVYNLVNYKLNSMDQLKANININADFTLMKSKLKQIQFNSQGIATPTRDGLTSYKKRLANKVKECLDDLDFSQ